ncbi:MAG TPA: Ser-Thr-rich GPI-anchored membrane family protein, partial [Candidatus Deferrimicrobium sp.]|nr:Ser-Thr-rich GPI-anchored membrane family protein [Candidatus Deferrimicrobium sp.]
VGGCTKDHPYYKHIEVSGDYLYAVELEAVDIIDISNPATPTLVYRYTSPIDERVWFYSATIYGQYLYISGYRSPGGILLILDISNPKLPVKVTENSIPYGPYITVNGDYAYISWYDTSLWVVDISDPVEPVLVGSLDISYRIGSFRGYGSRLYIPAYNGGLVIADISNPTTPNTVGQFSQSAYFNTICLSGKYAYLSGRNCTRIFDFTIPAVPILKGYMNTGGANAHISGNFLYLITGGFLVADISNPSLPHWVWETHHMQHDDTYDLSISGDYLFISDGDDGFVPYDISDPANPKLDAMRFPGDLRGNPYHDAKDKYFYVETGTTLYIYDTSNLPDVAQLSSIDIEGEEICADSTLKYVYIMTYSNDTNQSGIKIVDITDPTAPRPVGAMRLDGPIPSISGDGTYLYMAASQNGIKVYNISDPLNPKLACSWNDGNDFQGLVVKGNYVYAAGGNSGKFYTFEIIKTDGPSITVTSPNSGEIWNTASTHNITWLSQDMTGAVNIALYKGNSLYSRIGKAAAAAGVFSWQIPANLPAGNDYKIRVYNGSAGDYSDLNFSIALPVQIYLNKTSLYFITIGGIQTSPQTVTIGNKGGGALNWTAQSDQQWIQVTPNSGFGNKKIQVNVQSSGLAYGNYSGVISISDPAAINSPQVVTVKLTVAASSSVPF